MMMHRLFVFIAKVVSLSEPCMRLSGERRSLVAERRLECLLAETKGLRALTSLCCQACERQENLTVLAGTLALLGDLQCLDEQVLSALPVSPSMAIRLGVEQRTLHERSWASVARDKPSESTSSTCSL